MESVTAHTTLICSLCLKQIEEGEECLKFFNKGRAKNPTKQPCRVNVKGGQVHFRHYTCQYNTRPRPYTLEEFIRQRKEVTERTRHNRKAKRMAEKVKDEVARLMG